MDGRARGHPASPKQLPQHWVNNVGWVPVEPATHSSHHKVNVLAQGSTPHLF